MRLLYGGTYRERLLAVADHIPHGSSVTELCAGFGDLYMQALRLKEVDYTGYDLNARFVKFGKKRGLNLILADINAAKLGLSDYVIIQSSLYQFIPYHKQLIDRALTLARKQVIVTEPVRNLSDSSIALVAWIAKRSANPGTGHKSARFNLESAQSFFHSNYDDLIVKECLIAGNQELLVVLKAGQQSKAIQPA